ncbi:thyroid receptor-interacting protein 11-like isoform X2 [Nematostella vectensis]|uniref:thyroid receptor-interacting protein 11-like isoform X2 n=1 Tax=Nematostella vectensis TaxID=45351 RepID=UPI0020778D8E|nr:thyroid receptor-interacting protein 11-like isoform X2 [Nematostella vectensis]
MSWLGNNLNLSGSLSSISNITGQISNFTREMLTEGTEEIADPSAELNVSRNRISELEAIINSQKIEYDRLKHLNDELHERVEATELQLRDMCQDYRGQLARREQEIIELKAELHKRDDLEPAGQRHRHDSGESFEEHEEIKSLKNEIVRLQTECHHWKSMSSNQDSQEKLHREIDQYQNELSALQSTYSQKIANLNKKFKGEMQRWEDERQDYQRRIDDLQHELNILEEVDNLEGMKTELGSSGSDVAALKEELELAHKTIEELRQQLDRTVEYAKKKSCELNTTQINLDKTTGDMRITEKKLDKLQKKEKLLDEQGEKGSDITYLHEQLVAQESHMAEMSNEINSLKEELQQLGAERDELVGVRNKLTEEEARLRESLHEVKEDVNLLSASTLELMEELEHSQGVQKEQCFEINCLKKVCTVKGEAKDEIIHLKNVISALWERYLSTLHMYQQVRHELLNSNHRLLAQLQARHVITPASCSALAQRKQEELAFTVCDLLLSLIVDKERLVELETKLTNTQSVRKQVAGVRHRLEVDTENHQKRTQHEKDGLHTKSSELRAQIEEQESLVEDLQADNEQILQETKDMIAEVGCQTINDSLDERNDLVGALHAEKAVLESTIVGLQSKVQDLKNEIRALKGKPIKVDISDYYYSEDTRSDFLGDAPSGDKTRSIDSLTHEQWEGKQVEEQMDSLPHGQWEGKQSDEQMDSLLHEQWEGKQVEEPMDKQGEKQMDVKACAYKDEIISTLRAQLIEYQGIIDRLQGNKVNRPPESANPDLEVSQGGKPDDGVLDKATPWGRQDEGGADDGLGGDGGDKGTGIHGHVNDDVVALLRKQLAEYQANVEEFEIVKADYEGDKKMLEGMVMDLKKQLRTLREEATKNEAEKEAIQESGWESINNSEVLDSLRTENEELIKEKVALVKSLRSLEQQLIETDIVKEDDICGFESETERIDTLILNIKDWVIRMRSKESFELTSEGSSLVSVSLDDSTRDGEGYQLARQTIEELEFDNSMLREKTNDLINRIEAKTTEVGLIQAQLEEKCTELGNVESEKQYLVSMINERDEKLYEIQDSFEAQLLDLTSSRDNDVEILRSEQESMHQVLTERQQECETLRNTTNELITSIHEKQQVYEELSEENRSLAEHVQESERLLQDLRNEKENLRALLESKEQLVMSYSEEMKNLTKDNNELSVLVEEYQVKLHEKDKELTNLSNLEFEVDQLSRQSKDNDFSRHSMEEKIGNLSGDNERLSTLLEERDLHLHHVKSELKEKTSEVEYLGGELDRLNELVGSNLAVRKDLERQVSTLKRDVDMLNSRLQNGETSIDSLKLDLREKGAENDLLRLEIAKITKSLKEKEDLLGSAGEKHEAEGGTGKGGESQAQVARLVRVLQEKDQEIAAMRQKEASLIDVVNQTDHSSHEAIKHYQHQIEHLTEETTRLMAEVDEKNEQLFTMNDRLEVMQEQMQGKAQASTMLHNEHGRLLALNESQGNEIAKLRERIGTMVHRLEENEKHKHDEIHRLNQEFQQHTNASKQEQERLKTLLHEKDKQIIALADAAVPVVNQTHLMSSTPQHEADRSQSRALDEIDRNQSRALDEIDRTQSKALDEADRNQIRALEDKVLALEGELAGLSQSLQEKSQAQERLLSERDSLQRNSEALEARLKDLSESASSASEKDNTIRTLEDEVRMLKGSIESSESELRLLEESFENSKDALAHELEEVRLEKDEILLNKNKESNELRNKLVKAFNSLGDCNFALNPDGHIKVEKNFQSIVQEILSQRQSVLREKDNEIRTLKNQISNLNVLQHSSHQADTGLESILHEREQLSEELMRANNEKEDIIRERETTVADLEAQIIELTNSVSTKEKSVTQEIETIKRDKERADKEMEQLRSNKKNLEKDLTQVKGELSRLGSEADRLTGLVAEEKGNSARLKEDLEQYKQLLQEKEARLGEVAREREQLNKTNEQLQHKVFELQGELSSASGGQKETEAKMARELDRLREHLIQVEESYTREALNAEEREKHLRTRLAQAEEQILSNSHSMQDQNRQASQQVESLQEQLHAISGHRDEAVMQLAAVQEQAQQYATSLDNLQMVLEQFQREKDAQLYAIHDSAQQQVNQAHAEVKRLQQRENELQVQLESSTRLMHEIGNLKQEVAHKNDEIDNYKAQVAKLEEDLQVCHVRIRDITTSNDNKVDKPLLKNLLIGYFHTPEAKRADVIHVIGGLLGFTVGEMKEIGSGSQPPSQGGWISSLLPFGGPRSPGPKKPTFSGMDKSFTELFVNFLEHESDAQSPLQTRRGGTTANPLLSAIPPQPSPLAAIRAGERQPFASSTPVRPPTTTSVAMGVGPPPSATGQTLPVMSPAPVAMPTGGLSPIVSPAVRSSIPVPLVTQSTATSISSVLRPQGAQYSALRPQGAQSSGPRAHGAQSSVSNPLLAGLPAMSTSSPSQALRNVLFQAASR